MRFTTNFLYRIIGVMSECVGRVILEREEVWQHMKTKKQRTLTETGRILFNSRTAGWMCGLDAKQ